MSFMDNISDRIKEDIRSGKSLSESDQKTVEQMLDKANNLTNLVTVCKKCHSQLEPQPVEKQTELVDATLPQVHP